MNASISKNAFLNPENFKEKVRAFTLAGILVQNKASAGELNFIMDKEFEGLEKGYFALHIWLLTGLNIIN